MAEVTIATIDRHGEDRFQSLRRALGVNGFGMNVIRLQPRQRGRIHSHTHQEEVYVVLEGELTLVVEGEQHLLRPDQLARVGPGIRRQLVNTGPDRLVLVALGGSGEHVGRDGEAWAEWSDTGPGKPPPDVPLPEDLPA
jgi:mannose-6-phosphate isomerase-like protein (cupin superfamily)